MVHYNILVAMIAELLTDASASIEWIYEGKNKGKVYRRYFKYRLSIHTHNYDHALFVSRLIHKYKRL